MWHGTGGLDPKIVYSKDGLNINYSSDKNRYGKGLYFAKDANYSCSPRFSYAVVAKPK
jgi:hypothetical protein